MSDNESDGTPIPRTKIVIVGETGVGKSSIVTRFLEKEMMPTKSTIGVETRYRTIEIGGKKVKMEIWDTAGQERYRSMIRGFFRNAKGVMIVFDLTNQESLDKLEEWLKELENSSALETAKIILGNKADLDQSLRIPDTRVGETLKGLTSRHQNIIGYLEVSAMTGERVDEAFNTMAQELIAKTKFIATQSQPIALKPAPKVEPPTGEKAATETEKCSC
jgi:small GTP-binding protein